MRASDVLPPSSCPSGYVLLLAGGILAEPEGRFGLVAGSNAEGAGLCACPPADRLVGNGERPWWNRAPSAPANASPTL